MNSPGPLDSESLLDREHRRQRAGLCAGIAAFTAWGLVPLYWRQIRHVPAMEILAHRMLWSLVFTAALLTFGRQWPSLRQSRRNLAITALRGGLVGANWLIFIWAVNAGHIVETSMGYFITPILSLVFGGLVFREILSRRQWLAVALATTGVAVAGLATQHGFPWIAVSLALTFASYGVLRKMSALPPLAGLFLETAFMAPLGVAYLIFHAPAGAFLPVSRTTLFLIGGGLITAYPLLWFARAARQLRMTTLSFIQFLAPTLSFLVGVFLFHESFSHARLLAFGFIWAGVLCFSLDAWLSARERRLPVSETNQ